MGKGDKKTKKGKIIQGSYGVTRPRKAGSGKKTPVILHEIEKPLKPKAKVRTPKKAKEEQP